ncbi:uncharacterized protein P174DRAFT_476347 [Aspergillus novofumigatus IBT 16806]|uniref:Uncharacterized protein n=1 Tax=Aspergillus novofumigatus (strain IBT 16806) TaxID=1392255 RepID=A0A2I1CH86_ASPN1|nr:uncharacterized protein P174DRAFT_476347 [Aspergillus novofumigatus IBT 16806]PKX96985.1 hypothetical protein P174DRAFT_476347 [Aspergillus novofumigatus IBT 16806]
MDLDEDPNVIPEDHLEEASCPDYRQEDAAIKAAKEAKVKRVLQVETDLAEDPDALLEMNEETLEKAKKRSTESGTPY